jgi:hypothetical protein
VNAGKRVRLRVRLQGSQSLAHCVATWTDKRRTIIYGG